MVANQWTNDAMVPIHGSGLDTVDNLTPDNLKLDSLRPDNLTLDSWRPDNLTPLVKTDNLTQRTIWHCRQFDTTYKNGQFDTADNLTLDILTPRTIGEYISWTFVSDIFCQQLYMTAQVWETWPKIKKITWCQFVCCVKLSRWHIVRGVQLSAVSNCTSLPFFCETLGLHNTMWNI